MYVFDVKLRKGSAHMCAGNPPSRQPDIQAWCQLRVINLAACCLGRLLGLALVRGSGVVS